MEPVPATTATPCQGQQPVKFITLQNKLLILGLGAVARASLPLLLRHLSIKSPHDQVIVLNKNDWGREFAERLGVRFISRALTSTNFRAILDGLLSPKDVLCNLSVDVSTTALIEYCAERGILYLDTAAEPWCSAADSSTPVARRTNYNIRDQTLALKKQHPAPGPTALVMHGANPGMVSHFVKKALVTIARDTKLVDFVSPPTTKEGWARLAQRLGIKVIHVAERDTQTAPVARPPSVFMNTWSIEGFAEEAAQPAESGWGTHEKRLPPEGHRFDFGPGNSIYLDKPGMNVPLRSWNPIEGPYRCSLITHIECMSIADTLTLRNERGEITYNPTVSFAYRCCDLALTSLLDFAARGFDLPEKRKVLIDELCTGRDDVGVLLGGNPRGALWYGSCLSVEDARRMVPSSNATTLQVACGVLSGIVWMLENPTQGIVEPDDVMDFERMLQLCGPYLGDVRTVYTDWTPLEGRGKLFPEPDLDYSDPWQFVNVRV